MFEYVALGIPVVSADLPTIVEHFSEEEVLFFRAGDAKSLTSALRTIARDPAAARTRASAALRRYTESYSWSTNAQRYASALEGIRNGSGPRYPNVEPIAPRPEPVSRRPPVRFEASEAVVFFDHFRIPYRQVTLPRRGSRPSRRASAAIVRAGSDRRRRCRSAGRSTGPHSSKERRRQASLRLPPHTCSARSECTARLLPEHAVSSWLAELPGNWRPAETIREVGGARISAVWSNDAGCIFLPFDPSEVISSYWSEDYRLAATGRPTSRGLTQLGLRFYYRLRPLIRRAFNSVSADSSVGSSFALASPAGRSRRLSTTSSWSCSDTSSASPKLRFPGSLRGRIPIHGPSS